MRKFRLSLMALMSLMVIGAFALGACAPAATPEPPTEEPMEEPMEEPTEEPMEEPMEEPELGSMESPIKVLFVPSVNVDFMVESGADIEAFLNEATGLNYEVSVPTSYAATIEEMCASPTDTVGFIPAMGYALANQLCGVEPALASVRFGWNVYFAQYIVARDSEFQTLEDLEGATWGFGDTSSTSGYLVPFAELNDLGVTVGEQVETGGHTATVNAVYNGEVDFGTTFFSPPLLPEGTWAEGDPADIPEELIPECAVTPEDRLYCGAYRVLDARAGLRTEAPDVVQKVRILDVSAGIPNDTMSFSPDFPEDVRTLIVDAVLAYLDSDACQVDAATICAADFYEWTGAAPIFDENFDGIRLMMEAQGITLENVGG
jgi:phosphonate transport system substrate-binding protein